MAANVVPITQPAWHALVVEEDGTAKKIKIPARPSGLWTKVADFVPARQKLKLKVLGDAPMWTYDPDKACCGAEGATGASVTGTLAPWALAGCLVGKVGGSASDITTPPAAAGASGVIGPSLFVFAVGGFCIVQVPDTISGALFLAMNDSPPNFQKHSGELTVEIHSAP